MAQLVLGGSNGALKLSVRFTRAQTPGVHRVALWCAGQIVRQSSPAERIAIITCPFEIESRLTSLARFNPLTQFGAGIAGDVVRFANCCSPLSATTPSWDNRDVELIAPPGRCKRMACIESTDEV